MCGIVAVLARPSTRPVPDADGLRKRVGEVSRGLMSAADDLGDSTQLYRAIEELKKVDAALRGPAGLRALMAGPDAVAALEIEVNGLSAGVEAMEKALDQDALWLSPEQQEQVSAAVVALKDVIWAIGHDRIGMARRVNQMMGRPKADLDGLNLDGLNLDGLNLDGWWAIEVALASLDRLEVRGRDSAGIHVLVAGLGPDASGPTLGRADDPTYGSGSVRYVSGCLSFVYKAAAEIGELGDNVRSLRAAISADDLLARAIEAPAARVTVVAHTRWASVGIISEANAHPVNSDEPGRPDAPYLVAALNGDVDNHMELRQSEGLRVTPEITTDAKIIPVLVSRQTSDGHDLGDAFRRTVGRFEGSVAIAASAAGRPDDLLLALGGSGQSLYIGLADDAFVVASEPYGLVEETSRYVRMEGESSQGQVVALSREDAGTVEGITRSRYSGSPMPVSQDEVVAAQITTRDVDRRGFRHFLLKELTEAPDSLRKTLRGRIAPGADGHLTVRLGEDTIPAVVSRALEDHTLQRVVVIGQGTAAVAGQSVAAALRQCMPEVPVLDMPATELSGFWLSDDMSDTLVIAISQSGTTTDTNRTVDLVRTRGAHVIAVVNRRNSDLAAKAHGVLHTSDGRDVEMSVASTKAFYAQVAAGWLLAAALAQRSGSAHEQAADDRDRVLQGLRDLPDAMERLLAKREEIGAIAAAVAPPRRYWAVVGSGPDRIAAAEIRIKLSELCYRSISADSTEDKKHIDLSCEPMVLVCAAGLRGSNADDVCKEVAIYRAHKAAPVVIATEGEEGRFAGIAGDVVTVPPTDPAVGFVLSAMVGHLFGYEAARSIDGQAAPLRQARAAIEKAITDDRDRPLESLGPDLARAAEPFQRGLRDGSYNGNLEASTAVRLESLLRYATGALPLDGYESETGKIGSPAALIADLLDALSRAIDELTRPIDAIKHQAKTVTVGISRSEDALFGTPLVKATLDAGAAPDALGYRALRTLGALDESVAEVLGYTRYRIEWTPSPPNVAASTIAVPTIAVIDQGGIGLNMRSRTDRDPRLLGSKHRAAEEREVTVVKGASDGRTVVLVPEAKGRQVVGMTLLHVRFHERLPADRAKVVLCGYRTRYNALADAVTETEPGFDEERLGREAIVDLLTEPVYELARRWRTRPAPGAAGW